MREDLHLIADLVNPGARVLDLGCGDGELLAHLQLTKQVNGYGLEIDSDNIATCISKGVNVLEQDLDAGLDNFDDNSFHMVVMTETLQSVKFPHRMLQDMLRIGQECIVTFPNFGHWRHRLEIGLQGRMPHNKHLPYEWFDTPNIRLCTVTDFEQLCHDNEVRIIERFVTSSSGNQWLINRFPNWFGKIAFYRLGRESRGGSQ